MRTIHVMEAKADMIVTKDIYNSDGKVLVAKGVKLTERYIDRLLDYRVRTIEVHDDTAPQHEEKLDLPLDPLALTKEEVELFVNRSIRKLIKTDAKKQDLMLLVEEMFEVITNDSLVLEYLFKMKVIGDRTFFHTVQVAVLSVATGLQLELGKPELISLGKAALLYDIGKIFLPRDILTASEKYTDKQQTIMREHTISGYMLLQTKFDETIAAVALQHHERYDGSGYPRRVDNDQIHLFARIVAVADVYMALKSYRSYRPAYQPYEAIEYILGAGGYLFDSRVVSAFTEVCAIYSLGSVVQLNDGRAGIVSGINRSFSQRPEVTLMFDKQMLPTPPETVDLSRKPTSFISRVLHD